LELGPILKIEVVVWRQRDVHVEGGWRYVRPPVVPPDPLSEFIRSRIYKGRSASASTGGVIPAPLPSCYHSTAKLLIHLVNAELLFHCAGKLGGFLGEQSADRQIGANRLSALDSRAWASTELRFLGRVFSRRPSKSMFEALFNSECIPIARAYSEFLLHDLELLKSFLL